MQLVQEAEVLFDLREVFGPEWQKSRSSSQFCGVLPLLCSVLETHTEDFSTHDDREAYMAYMGHYPQSSPLRSLLHFAQNMQQKTFQKYAHGYTQGNDRTVEFELSGLKEIPTALFAGKDDTFATTTDARLIRN